MGKYTQAHQPIAVTTPLDPDALLLERFTGSEEMSRLFRFELDMLAESATDIAFDKLLGQKISVSLKTASGAIRYFSGIVSQLTQGKRILAPSGDEFVRYRAEMVPQFWLWQRRTQSRIFQQLSVPDILKQVLQGLDVTYQIQGTFQPRDYCVQYRESDFAFASRLMEEEGIFYFFEHSADGHRLVVANTPSSHPDLSDSDVVYDDVEGGARPDERVFAWEKTQEVRSGKVTLWDHCFELPGQNLAASQEVQDSVMVGTVNHKLKVADNNDLELYDYPGCYAQRFDGVDPGGAGRSADLQKIFTDNLRTAGIRMQQETLAAILIQGESNCRQFISGYKFNLDRHPTGKGSYVLTRVEHAASLEGSYAASEMGAFKYENHFQAIPPFMPLRAPCRTPKPTIAGTQTATVVGPSGQEIFVDKYGRVKVQFNWDRQGKNNANSSCWVRVGQLWAGNRWGGFFWPRVGHEVIVAFEEGDPDQPIIVGSVYNAKQMPPFVLPQDAMIAGIKSCSFGKGADPLANFNGIVIYDDLGNEHLQLHSERTDSSNSESTKVERVGQTRMHVTGGFGIPGGSGSGSGDGNGEVHKHEGPPFAWNIGGQIGQSIEFVVGEAIEVAIGLAGDYTIGTYVEVIVNPLGWIAQAGGTTEAPVAPTASIGAKGVGGVMGELTMVLGADTMLVYGPFIEINHGNKIEYEAHLTFLSVLGASLVSALYVAGGITGAILTDPKTAYITNGVLTGAAMIATGILTTVESRMALLAAATKKGEEAEALTKKITQVATPLAEGIADTAESKTMAAVNFVGQLATNAQASATQALSHNRTFAANYTVNAFDISLISGFDPVANPPPIVPPAATTINIQAMGVAPLNQTGILNLQGTQQAAMTSGLAMVGVAAEVAVGNATVQCGPEGQILLQRGPEPEVGQYLVMVPGAIQMVQQLPGNMTLQVFEGNILIQAGAATITLNGADGGIEITGGAITVTGLESIELAVEENSVSIGPQGVQITGLTNQIQAEVQLQTQALAEQLSVQGEQVAEIVMAMIE